jgi:hypothetical protein
MKKHKRLIASLAGCREAGRTARIDTLAWEMSQREQDWESGHMAGEIWASAHWVTGMPDCEWADDLVIAHDPRYRTLLDEDGLPVLRWIDESYRGWGETGIEPIFRGTTLVWRQGYADAIREAIACETAAHPCYLEVARLGYWIGLAKQVALMLWERGTDFFEVRNLPTRFVQWEVGGTYRHSVLLVGAHGMDEQGGHYRPGWIGAAFGRGSNSFSGVYDTPEGLVVYQDQ